MGFLFESLEMESNEKCKIVRPRTGLQSESINQKLNWTQKYSSYLLFVFYISIFSCRTVVMIHLLSFDN